MGVEENSFKLHQIKSAGLKRIPKFKRLSILLLVKSILNNILKMIFKKLREYVLVKLPQQC